MNLFLRSSSPRAPSCRNGFRKGGCGSAHGAHGGGFSPIYMGMAAQSVIPAIYAALLCGTGGQRGRRARAMCLGGGFPPVAPSSTASNRPTGDGVCIKTLVSLLRAPWVLGFFRISIQSSTPVTVVHYLGDPSPTH